MKKNNHFSLFVLVIVLILFSCAKENNNELSGLPEGAVLLTTEGYTSNNKTSTSDKSVQWENGDMVNLNGTPCTVNVVNEQAYVTGFTLPETDFYGYYPADLTVGTPNSNTTTITVPASYNSTYSSGRQLLHLPMVAKAESNAGAIRFRHVTAAVKVLLKNTTGVNVVLDSVVVSSRGVQLCGIRSVTIDGSSASVAAQTAGDVAAADTSVRVVFTDSPVIANGGDDIKEVQVPILPVAAGEMTIKVYTHVPGMVEQDNKFIFSHRATNDALGRNVMITARVIVKASGTGMVTVPKGLFSVSNTQKVYFSQGNLQYVSGNWQFATNQYDYLGSSQSNTGRDLFGWGTGSNPNQTSSQDADYGTFTDWGSNTIANGGEGWCTLSSEEWTYLFNTRNASEIDGTPSSRFVKAQVGGTHGVILFPDGYSHPAGVKTPMGINETNNSGWNNNDYSANDWAKMEATGAVFLPAAGIREGTTVSYAGSQGYYWSSTSASENAKRLQFDEKSLYPFNGQDPHYGCSVRLVKIIDN